jgi:replication factor C subunit 3/5
MYAVMAHVAKKERFDLPPAAAREIAADANGNLRKALLVLEALKMQSFVSRVVCSPTSLLTPSRPDLAGPLAIAKPDWETYCHKLAELVLQEQTPDRVMLVRGKFYELLTHCIPPTIILKTVADELVRRVDDSLKAEIMHWAAIYVCRARGAAIYTSQTSNDIAGEPHASGQQENLSPRGVDSQGHGPIQGTCDCEPRKRR